MIPEVDAALCALLGPLLPAGAAVRVGPPDAHADDVLNLHLSAVRACAGGAPADWTDVRGPDGRLIGRRAPIRRYELHYLVTAQGKPARRGELLDAVVVGVVPDQRLDPGVLTGSLAATPAGATEPPPVTVRLGDPPPEATLCIIVNAPYVPPLNTDLAGAAERITLRTNRSVTAPPSPLHSGRSGRWARSQIEEDAGATGREDE